MSSNKKSPLLEILQSLVGLFINNKSSSNSGGTTTQTRSTKKKTTRTTANKGSSSGSSLPWSVPQGTSAPQAKKTTTKAKPSAPKSSPSLGTTYPGDYRGAIVASYDPLPNGEGDPGEVVWTWVPYEEDHSQGKDRPVLLIGYDGPWFLALMLTSKEPDSPRDYESMLGIGPGAWDKEGRESWVKLDRVIRVNPQAIRREGSTVSEKLFYSIIESRNGLKNW